MNDGQQLVNDFQTAMVTRSTAAAAEYEASRSEHELLDHLDALSSGHFLQPNAIDGAEQTTITHGSLDAHFKKVQATQLGELSAGQLQELTAQAKSYHGRRVQVQVLTTGHKSESPIDLITFNRERGYATNTIKRRTVSGVIEEVMFDRNLIVLKPRLGMRLLNSSLKNYVVYVINPDTLEPFVSLTLQ